MMAAAGTRPASLGCRLDRALTVLCRRLTRAALRSGTALTPVQLYVLRSLQDPPPATVTGLAGELGIGPSAVTLLLNRLEAMQLVARRRHPSDRRVVRVILTARGRAVLARAEAERARLADRYLARLSADQAEAVVEALERMASEGPVEA